MKKYVLFFLLFIFSVTGSSCESEESIKIHFQTNLGTPIDSITYSGNLFDLPNDPTREGYTFQGWYFNEEFMQPFSMTELKEMDQDTVVLYAKWEINSYWIQFDTQGGELLDPISQVFDEDFPEIQPIKEGYDFLGWYLDQSLTIPFTQPKMPARDLMLYAKWEETTIYRVIYFDENGGDNITLLRQPVGSPVIEPEYVHKDGHTFLGWYADPELLIPYTFDVMPDENTTVYAKWEIRMCTLFLDENGGDPIDDLVQWYGTPITLPIPTREGYEFRGWYNMNHTYFNGTTMPDNIMIYAMWKSIIFHIDFLSEGEVVGGYVLLYGKVMEEHHIAIPVREGYTFGGWYMDEAWTIPYDFDQPVITQITLYAKWIINPS